jgi:formylglycine-generating enzyme required for sulfatase activity
VDALHPDFRLRVERPLETFSCGAQTHEIGVFVHVPTRMEFSLIPVGTFYMGSPPEAPGREENEGFRRVTLTRPFLIARTEVTRETWIEIMGREPKGSQRPRAAALVGWIAVSPEDADPPGNPSNRSRPRKKREPTFCERTGLRLPTEAEWEYACRAGTSSTWCTGPDERELARVAPNVAGPSPLEVMSLGPASANAFGLFDVHGNAWELCSDRWTRDLDPNDLLDPRGPASGELRVRRGGGIGREPHDFRSAVRTVADPLVESSGFRPAATVRLP